MKITAEERAQYFEHYIKCLREAAVEFARIEASFSSNDPAFDGEKWHYRHNAMRLNSIADHVEFLSRL
jgi:hypothetical protein